jgi:hypothetical protein
MNEPIRSKIKRNELALVLVFVTLNWCAATQAETRVRRTADDPNAATQTVVPSTVVVQPQPLPLEKPDEFNGKMTKYWFGYEGPAVNTTSIFKQPAVSFGSWVTDSFGYELYLGYGHGDDTYNSTTVTTVDTVGDTSNTTTTYAGTTTPATFLFGGAFKYKVYQGRWFGISADFMMTLTPGTAASYQTGSHSVTTPNTNAPATQSVTDTELGNVTTNASAYFRMGPRISANYNLPFVPNLQLGASVGIFLGFGGNSTTTTSTQSQTYQVLSGANQTPTNQTNSNNSVTNTPGNDSNTYAIGGTGLNIGNQGGLSPLAVVGTFRICYAF